MKPAEGAAFRIAITGNPNSGKTSIFNALTGARQKIGNWPGVTVEKKEAFLELEGRNVHILDLPGIYSLTPHSIEEKIAFDQVVSGGIDLVIDVVDASNIERHLYLASQLIETRIPTMIVLNMMDLADQKKLSYDLEKLSVLTGAVLVKTAARTGRGIRELRREIIQAAVSGAADPEREIQIAYPRDVEETISNLEAGLLDANAGKLPMDSRWLAIKMLEKEKAAAALFDGINISDGLIEMADLKGSELGRRYRTDIRQLLTNWRYGFINGLLKETMSKASDGDILGRSRNIDKILTNKYLGLPIFFFFLWLTFKITFELGQVPMDWIDQGVAYLANYLTGVMPNGLLQELLVDGIISGVGGILVFLPNIFILFFIISLMEDSGYMARAAFIMDRIMHGIGLHGKAFIPMVMGFGCNVPAIVGTRILESERDRLLSILINPLMSCSARLPVYILLTGAFFPENAAMVILSIYVIGIVLAVIIGKLFSKTILKGNSLPFVMELPPYLPPRMASLALHTWERGSMFIKKMGTIILVGSILIWSFSAFPRDIKSTQNWDGKISQLKETGIQKALDLEKQYENDYQELTSLNSGDTRVDASLELKNFYIDRHGELEDSIKSELVKLENKKHSDIISQRYLGRIGRTVQPILAPIGIDWQGSVGLIVGFIAKEFVVSTYGIILGFGSEEDEHSTGIIKQLRKSAMTPLSAFVFMIFTLIYTPCLATVATIRQETKSWKWTLFSVFYSLILAWTLSFLIYQSGLLLGLGA